MTPEDKTKLKAWLLWYQKDAERLMRADVPTDRQHFAAGSADAIRRVISMLPRFEKLKIKRPCKVRS